MQSTGWMSAVSVPGKQALGSSASVPGTGWRWGNPVGRVIDWGPDRDWVPGSGQRSDTGKPGDSNPLGDNQHLGFAPTRLDSLRIKRFPSGTVYSRVSPQILGAPGRRQRGKWVAGMSFA